MKTTLLTNFILLNGHKDMTPETGWNLLLEGRKIAKLSKDKLKADRVIDLKGQYLLPGLIDLHVHLPGSGPIKNNTDSRKLVKAIKKIFPLRQIGLGICKKSLKEELYGGTTTIRCVGGISNFDTELRNSINKRWILGPRVLAANEAITAPGGHMEGTVSIGLSSKEEIIKHIDNLKKYSVDLVKLMITGGVLDAKKVGEPGDLKMSYEQIKAAVDYAHTNNLPVSAHVEGEEGLHLAIQAGVNYIEHGSSVNKDDLKLMKEKKLSLVATLSPALPLAKGPYELFNVKEVAKINSNALLERMITFAKQCMENDIPVGFGTDSGCPSVKHYNTYLEAYYASKYLGLSNKEALYALTLNNAKVVKLDNITGSIDVGKSADMIVVKDNPLDNLLALKDISHIFIRGKFIKKVKLKKNKEVEEFIEKYLLD